MSSITLDKVRLTVNDSPVPIVDFVQVFIEEVVTGMLSTLKGIDEIRSVELSIDGDDVDIKVNNSVLPSNEFVDKFVRNTVIGMITSLKDVGQTNKLEISIKE